MEVCQRSWSPFDKDRTHGRVNGICRLGTVFQFLLGDFWENPLVV